MFIGVPQLQDLLIKLPSNHVQRPSIPECVIPVQQVWIDVAWSALVDGIILGQVKQYGISTLIMTSSLY